MLARPVLSVVTTYLVVAALSVGTLLAFGLGGPALAADGTSTYRTIEWDETTGQPTTDPATCGQARVEQVKVPRFDLVWGSSPPTPT